MDIDAVSEVDFSADAILEGALLTAKVTGSADLNVRLALDRFLTAVHSEAQLQGVREVMVDVRSLDFMNSSCLKSLVSWVTRVQDLPRPHQYRITFLSSPTLYWQRRSLHALSCLAEDLVTIQT